MKRRFILTLLALAVLAGCVGCWGMEELRAQEAGFPELSFEEYVEVRGQIRLEYLKPPPKVFTNCDLIGRLLYPFYEYYYASVNGILDFPSAKRLSRYVHYLKAKKACGALGIDFQSFNHAHKIYGREGQTYMEQIAEYVELKPYYTSFYHPEWMNPELYKVYKRNRIEYGYQPKNVERFARLAIDLGHAYRESMAVIDIDTAGSTIVNQMHQGYPEIADCTVLTSLDDVNIVLDIDPYYLIFILPSPYAPSDALFKTVADMPNVYRLTISTKLTIPERGPFVRVWPMFDYESMRSGIEIFIEIDSETGTYYLNSQPQDDAVSLFEGVWNLLRFSLSKSVHISVDRDVPCGVIVNIAKVLREFKTDKIYLVPSDVIAGKRPRIQPPRVRFSETLPLWRVNLALRIFDW